MPVVRIDRLSYSYPSRQALQDVSFTVEKGEIFGLLGPNGGGKSTTFRILSTFLRAPAGAVLLFDIDAAKQPEQVRKKMGVVFQSGSLDRKLSVTENLTHQGHLYGMRGAPLGKRIGALLERFGLSDRARDKVESLSGGMRRRVEIAKGILHHPELLILDEPSTGLDPAVRLELWNYLDELRRNESVTVLLTTHFMEEAERCDRLAILDAGRVVAVGSPAQLKEEVGGEVLDIRSSDPRALASELQSAFGMESKFLNGGLRVEQSDAHRWIAPIMDQFGDRIESMTLGHPTLEDVFIHQTGHRMEEV